MIIHIAHIKKSDSDNFEEVRGYDDLNIQANCVIFQWFKEQQSLIIPFHQIDYITTTQEETKP